jgi:hypothetical protein
VNDKDWEARFKLGEQKPFPDWLVWALVCIIPLGPWYVEIPITATVALIAFFKMRKQ